MKLQLHEDTWRGNTRNSSTKRHSTLLLARIQQKTNTCVLSEACFKLPVLFLSSNTIFLFDSYLDYLILNLKISHRISLDLPSYAALTVKLTVKRASSLKFENPTPKNEVTFFLV